MQQSLKIFQIDMAEIVISAKLRFDIRQGGARHMPLVQGLHTIVPGLAAFGGQRIANRSAHLTDLAQ